MSQEVREEREIYEIIVSERVNPPRFAKGNSIYIPKMGDCVIDEIVLDQDSVIINGYGRFLVILKTPEGKRVMWRSYPAQYVSVTYDINAQI
jgi:hypothetical protein